MFKLRLIVGMLFVIFGLVGGVCFSAVVKKDCYYKGIDFTLSGEFEKAKREFEKILRVNVFYTPAHSSWQVAGDALESRVAKQTALDIFKGIDYANRDLLDRAIDEFTAIIEQNPYYVNTYFFRGSAYYRKKLYNQAISDFSKVIEAKGVLSSDSFYNRGSAYNKIGSLDGAVADYSKVIAIYSENADAYYNRGKIYAVKGQYGLAVADYNEVIRLDSKNSGVYFDKAKALFKSGEVVEGIKALGEFIKYRSRDFFAAVGKKSQAW